MRKRAVILVPVLVLAVASCATPPRGHGFNLPSDYVQRNGGRRAAAADTRWWTAFNDPALNALMNESLAANHTLAAGVERVAQARAGLRIAGAALLPEAGASASGDHDINNGDFSASARLSVSYELDLFGANRARLAGARAAWRGSVHDQRALELAVQADVAATWFTAVALDARLDVARRSLAAAEKILDLIVKRHEAGTASGFDLSRQRSAVASARASIAALEEQRVRTVNGLAILLGRPPEGFDIAQADFYALAPPQIEAGLPSDLLLRRPDLLAAEAALDGADADIRAARAAFFPRIDLAAALTGASLTGGASLLGDASASIFTTIFAGGRLRGGLDRAKARQRELVALYRQSILDALGEVENALAAVNSSALQAEQQAIAAREAERAARLSEIRYESGADDLLAVLDAQRSELGAADGLVQARLDQLTAAVDLFRALGGGWGSAQQAGSAAPARLAAFSAPPSPAASR